MPTYINGVEQGGGGGATMATGTYSGDTTDNRQITTGFQCSLVIIFGVGQTGRRIIVMPNQVCFIDDGTNPSGHVVLHGSDGFEVSDNTPKYMNNNGGTYYYWAISV